MRLPSLSVRTIGTSWVARNRQPVVTHSREEGGWIAHTARKVVAKRENDGNTVIDVAASKNEILKKCIACIRIGAFCEKLFELIDDY